MLIDQESGSVTFASLGHPMKSGLLVLLGLSVALVQPVPPNVTSCPSRYGRIEWYCPTLYGYVSH